MSSVANMSRPLSTRTASEDQHYDARSSHSASRAAPETKLDSPEENSASVTKAEDAGAADQPRRQGPVPLTGLKFWLMYICMLLSIFLVALDTTLISTAQTTIVQQLGEPDKISWVVSSFLLTQAAFLLFFGQILSNFSSKWSYMTSVFFFEFGSLICGVAHNMNTLIVGRAIAGIGAAGIFICAMTVLAETTELHQRAGLMGSLGAVYGLSMVLGPLLGGAITQHIGWRWNFYINLPVGGITMVSIFFQLESRVPLGHLIDIPMPIKEKLLKIDFVGLILALGWLVALITPLQDGGNQYPWSDGHIIGPLVASFAILALLVGWCWYRGNDRALVPLALLKDQNIVGCALTSALTYWIVIVNIYYLPRFYQAVHGSTPTNSGVDILPVVLGLSITSFVSGMIANKTGHYFAQMVFAPFAGIAGSAMLYTINADTHESFLIGAQILVGVGMGALIQNPILATQANVVHAKDTSRATGIVTFLQRIGGTVGTAVASAIFASDLPGQLAKYNVPPEYAKAVNEEPNSINSFPPGIREGAEQAFTKTSTHVYIMGVPLFIVDIFLIFFLIKMTNLRTKVHTSKREMPAKLAETLRRGRRPHQANKEVDVERAAEEIAHAAVLAPESEPVEATQELQEKKS